MIIQLKGYGRGDEVFVNTDKVTNFESYSSNSDSGTKIYLDDGKEILAGEWPCDVQKKLNDKC